MLQRYEQDLLTRISEVLHYFWDPIGVCGEPNARDEYDSYVTGIYEMLEGGANTEQIAIHLNKIAVGGMGLRSNMEHNRVTADRLLAWRAVLLERRPEILGRAMRLLQRSVAKVSSGPAREVTTVALHMAEICQKQAGVRSSSTP